MASRPNYGRNWIAVQNSSKGSASDAPVSSFDGLSAQFPADIQKFLPPLLANCVAIEVAQLIEGGLDGLAGGRDHGGGVTVRAADRLLEDGVDDAESQHILRCDLHAV